LFSKPRLFDLRDHVLQCGLDRVVAPRSNNVFLELEANNGISESIGTAALTALPGVEGNVIPRT
jgi:hypothetical protein